MPFIILVLVLFILFILVFRAAVWTFFRGLLSILGAFSPNAAYQTSRIAGMVWGAAKFLLAVGFLVIIAAIFCGK